MSTDILARNNVRTFGSGTRPIVFAHGFGCSQHMWRHLAPAFAEDHRVVLFDYVGAGGSRVEAYDAQRYGALRGYATDVLEICEALDLHDVIFVGHSVSSMIGVLAANREPERFARLVLVAASPCFRNEPPAYAGGFERAQLEELLDGMERDDMAWARYLAPLVAGNPDRPQLADEVEASFCATDRWIARRFAEVTFLSDCRRDLPRVRVPSLVLQCADDVLAPEAVGTYLHRHLTGSTLRRLPVSGHAPHLSHPVETTAAIREYLAA